MVGLISVLYPMTYSPLHPQRLLTFIGAIAVAIFLSSCGKSESENGAIDADTLAEQRETFKANNPEGRFRPVRGGTNDKDLADEERERREQIKLIENIGYLDGKNPAPNDSGVTIHASDVAHQGLNLYTSGHGPIAILMDMEGDELHVWKCDFDTAMRDFPEAKEGTAEINRPEVDREFWRRAYLYPNGDLLAIFEGSAIIKLDKDSNLIWAVPNHAHHDLQVAEDGTIYVLGRKAAFMPELESDLLNGRPILEDFVLVLDSDGKELRRVSILKALQKSPFASLVDDALATPHGGDIFHTNTLEVLDGRHADKNPAFKKGSILLSLLWINTIAVLDLEKEEIVWTLEGSWIRQHQPTLVESGNLMLFDNLGGSEETGLSRVLEIDPETGRTVWSFEGYPGNELYSEECGSLQRFGNDNTLITETDNGRALEVTADKKIVWEFVSPHRAGENDQLIASLFEVVRLPPDFPVDWIRD